jgi:agmatinase
MCTTDPKETSMIDPQRRWSRHADGKPDYAGLLTFGGLPYTEDLADLAGIDVAIIGAPMDELVSDRPGTRFGPRAIRAASAPHGVHLEAGIDAFEELRIVDYGDAAVAPADPEASHAAITALVAEVAGAGVIPVVLGGDHSITQPEATALASVHGPIGLVHFDTHTDTGVTLWERSLSHGTPMYNLVDGGHVDPRRYVQIGLRGYWPGPAEFGWQRELGITSFFAHDVRDRGIRDVVERAIAIVGPGPALLTVDVDVLDPAFAPGTGTPEPGGLTPTDLLWACRTIASRLDLVGSDVVEVAPTAVGSADVTALVGDRIIRESLTGIAMRRRDAAAAGG